jgi:predicted ATPase/DNA-binding CsgD family transcriptional regulator
MIEPVSTNSIPDRMRLIGRDAELATLLAAVQGCVHGRAQVMLMTGEPGVGKTRLMAEVVARAESELNVCVLSGYALEAGGTPPYFPIRRAIQRALAPLIRDRPEFCQPASILAAAGLVDAENHGFRQPASLAPDAERLRLFDAFADFCLQLAQQRPLLLALDDLHWADAGTWDMVAYAARAASAGTFGVLIACRDEILATGGAGQHALVELSRQRLLLHLPVSRLTPDAVRLLGQELLGGQLADDLAATLARRSEGNPFYAEEVLRGWQHRLAQDWSGAYYIPARERPAAEATTSATLRLTIVRRLETLPADTLALMKSASVLGRSFASRTLARMCECKVDDIERRLQPALVANVVSGAAGEYAFVHDLFRETAYELGAGDRRRLHEAAARALEQSGSRTFERAAALAHHWREADVPLIAARAAADAARAARQATAYAESLEYAASACELFEQALGADAATDELFQARMALAEAALTCGEYSAAEAAYRLVLPDAELRGERQLQGRLWTRLGVLYHRRERPEEAAACYHRALAVLQDADDSAHELVEVLIELTSLEGLTRARYGEASAFGERAQELASQVSDARLQAHVALALAGVHIRSITPSAGRQHLRQALDLALAVANPLLAAEVCGQLSNSHYWTGELQLARDYAQRRLELAEQAGDVFGMRHAHSWLANVLLTLGEFETARELLGHCEPLLERLDNPEPIAVVRMFSAVIALHLGEFERARELAAEAIEVLERVDPATVIWYRSIIVLACLALGQRADAERQLRTIEATLDTMPESALPARSARTVIGLAYAELGDTRRAAECERALRPFADDHHWWLSRRTLATLAALRGDTALALADLELAESQARRERLLPDLANILLHRAELLGPTRHNGQVALSEARELLARLGMRAALARADGMLAATPASPAAPAGLTRRELEVLRHVAHGRTNREIAEALSISEHTVVNHLSHIFGKIRVENRTTAAAYALRRGIASATDMGENH